MPETLRVYVDESSQNAHTFAVLGAFAAGPGAHDYIVSEMKKLTERHELRRELKWAKISRSYEDRYRLFVDLCLNWMRADELHFHSLVYKATQADHARLNDNVPDIGLNKLVYQLLLHKIGRRYGERNQIEVLVDERTTNQHPQDLVRMLNSALFRDYAIRTEPFVQIRFADSKRHRLIQAADLFTGAIAFRQNKWHTKTDASGPRCRLAEHIARASLKLQSVNPRHIQATRFTLWDFKHYAA